MHCSAFTVSVQKRGKHNPRLVARRPAVRQPLLGPATENVLLCQTGGDRMVGTQILEITHLLEYSGAVRISLHPQTRQFGENQEIVLKIVPSHHPAEPTTIILLSTFPTRFTTHNTT